MRLPILFIIFLFFSGRSEAQILYTNYSFSFGVNVNLNFEFGDVSSGETFPGIKAFVGLNISSRFKAFGTEAGSLNISSTLGIYNKSLGNSLNLGFQDNQIDWTTSVGLGALYGDSTYTKVLQSINNVPFYNIRHDGNAASIIGVNFIMNNQGRNQTNGFVSFTYDRFSFSYYNDGGPVIKHLALGDKFDRYWTGGLNMFYHQKDEETSEGSSFIPYNIYELAFDQFTGYSNQMYELSGLLGIDVQDYDVYQLANGKDSLMVTTRPQTKNRNKRSAFTYNASSYHAKYFSGPNLGMSLGVLGSLRGFKSGKAYGLQDWLHIGRGEPIHPSKDKNRIFLGLNYNSNL